MQEPTAAWRRRIAGTLVVVRHTIYDGRPFAHREGGVKEREGGDKREREREREDKRERERARTRKLYFTRIVVQVQSKKPNN